MSKFIDMTGQIYGRLIVIEPAYKKDRTWYWKCQCKCGNTTVVNGNNLRHGITKSCGCYKHQRMIDANIKHNGCYTRIYNIWRRMITRCYDTNYHLYKNHGGRGIIVCPEWKNKETGFITFREWAYFNGYSDDLTLDRINNDGNYEPSNCRWANYITQANNKRNNWLITLNGETKPFMIWCDEYGLRNHWNAIRMRIQKYGWSPEEAFLTPIGTRR